MKAKNLSPQTYRLTTPIQPDIDTPTSTQITDLIKRLPTLDPETVQDHLDYLILEPVESEPNVGAASYMQARPHRSPKYEGMFLVEYRDGRVKRHFRGYIEEFALPAVFTSYQNGDEAYLEMLVWRDISFKFDDLREELPAEEFAASFFPDGQWERDMEARKKSDQEFWEKWEK